MPTTTVTVTAAFLPNTSDALPVDTLVTVTVAGTTATTGTDYTTAPSSFTITIPATMTSGTSDIAVQVVDDMLAEEPETVTVSGTAAPVLPITPATLTIDDNDTAPTEITLSLSETGADEGASPTVTVMATLSGTVSLTADTVVTVTVGDTGDSATEVTDYIPVVDLLVTIAAGTTSGMSTFLFVPTDDTVHDPDETVTVSGTADGFDPITSLTLAINDTDTAPTEITLSATPPRVTEGATPTTVTVTATLSPTSVTLTGATEVTVSVGPGTAQAADFTAVGNVTVTIAAGATSGTGTFVLTVTAGDGVDANETLTVSGTTTATTITTITSATLTIDDTDAFPTSVILSLDMPSVTEGTSFSTSTIPDVGPTILTTSHYHYGDGSVSGWNLDAGDGNHGCGHGGGRYGDRGKSDDHGKGLRHGRRL